MKDVSEKEVFQNANKHTKTCSLELPGKCKLKPQQDITSCSLEWLRLKRVIAFNVGGITEK